MTTDRNIPPGTPMWGEIERTAREARAMECEAIREHILKNGMTDIYDRVTGWLVERAAAIRAGKA